jgi:hypothetical protein
MRFRGYPQVTERTDPTSADRTITGPSGNNEVYIGTARVIAEPDDVHKLGNAEILIGPRRIPAGLSRAERPSRD